ncbi:MAG: ATP-binding protein [Myxococcota bacterium]
MDPIRNPYTPGAGSRPPALAGRDAELQALRVLLERLRRGRPEKSMIITGLRGVGKTVLLNTFGSIAEEARFATAFTEITHETEFRPLMARLVRRALLSVSPVDRMKERARRAAAVFKAFTLKLPEGPEISVDVEAALGRGDSGDLGEDLADLFLALGSAAADHDSGVVFLFDEIQFLERTELEALIAALHRTAQQALPVTLVGAGLPQIPELTGAAKSYSERLFDLPRIGSLSPEEARRALVVPAEAEGVQYEEAAVEEIARFTEGYPYFLQEFGKHVWNLAEGPTITLQDALNARQAVQLQLDENFFRVRIARCTKAELKYLYAMAGLGDGPYRSGDIATKLGRAGPQNVAPTRSRLIEKGLIFSPSHGLSEFTVPQFAEYLRRSGSA